MNDERNGYLFDVFISWCLTDCYKENRILRHVNVTRPRDISDQDIAIAPCRFKQFYGRHILVTYAGVSHFSPMQLDLLMAKALRN